MLSIVIDDAVGAGDEAERERGGEGEPGKKEPRKATPRGLPRKATPRHGESVRRRTRGLYQVTLEGGCSLVDTLTVVIDDGICAGDPPSRKALAWQASAEHERGREGEPGEEEHLKCSHTDL